MFQKRFPSLPYQPDGKHSSSSSLNFDIPDTQHQPTYLPICILYTDLLRKTNNGLFTESTSRRASPSESTTVRRSTAGYSARLGRSVCLPASKTNDAQQKIPSNTAGK